MQFRYVNEFILVSAPSLLHRRLRDLYHVRRDAFVFLQRIRSCLLEFVNVQVVLRYVLFIYM